MSITTVRNGIQAVNAAITGVTTAPQHLPAALNTADLPCALTFVTDGAWNEHAIGLKRSERTYTVRVYVSPIAQGAGRWEGYDNCLALLQAFGEAYLLQNKAGALFGGTVEQISEVKDLGIDNPGPLLYLDLAYHGFVYQITVVEK